MKLRDQVALVTGAARGLGHTIAETLAAEGAALVLADVLAEPLGVFAKELAERGVPCTAMAADVSAAGDAEALVARAVQEFGRLDVAVNNAGVLDGMQMLDEADHDTYRRVMGVNCDGPFFVSQAALRQMLAQQPQGGSIINIASLASQGGMRGGVAYTMSKHAVLGLTRSVAFAYRRRGVRCNAILPGSMATPLVQGFDASRYSAQGMELANEGFQKLGTLITVDTQQVANTVAFLASEEAKHLNGAEIVVDAGGSAY